MAKITPLKPSLSYTQHLAWTLTQESTVLHEHPFGDPAEESADQYVVRTYLQFLWLPESIMPLEALVPSLLRVNVASGSDSSKSLSPHPLHALLDPLLLTARSASNKYHQELPHILSNGGGAGDIEENVMWYALHHEKAPSSEERSRTFSAGSSTSTNAHREELWMNELWRKCWLDKLERREIRIQILLLLLKMSLPGPPLPEEALPVTKKSKRKRRKEPEVVQPTTKERLESFMDKLSMWQLMGQLESETLNRKAVNGKTDERDWMQIFCEDIVEPIFKRKLPDETTLLRSKIFPTSPFSDDESSSSGSSTELNRPKKKRRSATETTRGPSRYPSPALTVSADANAEATTSRSRSRSLSVSLAEEKQRERAPSKKPFLVREVSMSRGFKPKPSNPANHKPAETRKPTNGANATNSRASQAPDEVTTLVAATPVKSKSKGRHAPLVGSFTGMGQLGQGGLGLSFAVKQESIPENETTNSEPVWSSPLTSDEEDDEHDTRTTPTKTKAAKPK